VRHIQICDRLQTEGFDEWKPFKIADPQDMASLQLCLKRGSTAKAKHYLWHLCQIHSDDIVLCNETSGSCTHAHAAENGHKCHHIILVNGDCIADARRELSGLQAIAEEQRLTRESRRIKVAQGKTKWAILYEKCKLRLLSQDSATSFDDCVCYCGR
jgi:hypothetical protein